VFAYDIRSGAIIDANDAAVSLFGYARRKLYSLKLADIIARGEEEFIGQSLQKKRAGPRVVRFRISDVDGRVTRIEGFATPITYAGRHAMLISVSNEDAPAKKRARQAVDAASIPAPILLEQVRRQEALIEFAKAAIAEQSDIELKRLGARLLRDGLAVDFVLAYEHQWRDRSLKCVAAEGWEGALDSITFDVAGDSLAAKSFRSRGVVAAADLDASDRPLDSAWFLDRYSIRAAIGIPIRSDTRDYGSLVGYVKNVKRFDEEDVRFALTVAGVIAIATEGLRARSKAIATADRLTEVLASIVEHFVHIDREWKIKFVNVTVESLFSKPAEELVGEPIERWFPSFSQPEHRRRYEDAMHDGIPSQFEFRSLLNDHWYEARVRPTPDGIAVYFLDITSRHDAEEKRLDHERRIRRLIDHMPAILWVTDLDLTIQTSIGGALRRLGAEDDSMVGNNLRRMFDDQAGPTISSHERALKGEACDYMDSFGDRTFESRVEPLRDSHGGIIGVAGLCIDVTERISLEHTLAEAQTLARFGTWTYDRESGERTISDELLRIFGRTADEMPADFTALGDAIHADDVAFVESAVQHAIRAGISWNIDHRINHKDGSVRHIQNVGRYDVDETGASTRGFGSVLDITERKIAESELVRLANFDVLTNLPNRMQVEVRLSESLGRALERGKLVALCCLDVDRFKNINDTLGHVAGDTLLKEVGDRLSSIVRRGDTVGRLGSDEFAIVFADVATVADLTLLADKVTRAFSEPFIIGGRELYVNASAGFSIYPGDACDSESLIRQADTAVHSAKESGGGQAVFFSSDMHDEADSRLEFQNSLYRALGRGEFRLHFQPIVDAASRRLRGFEALIRWEHPTLGLVPPDRFIPLAEQTGLIIPIGEWVLRQACSQALGWHSDQAGYPWVAVNISARQFSHPDLVSIVGETLRSSGLPADRLTLEVTESAVVRDIQAGAGTIRSLRSMGVKIAIDDFGIGYSSFGYLRSFAFDTVKIDRSFTRGLPEKSEDAAITRGIIALSQALGMTVTAEGVETEEQATFLAAAGCDSLQGYLIGRPTAHVSDPNR